MIRNIYISLYVSLDRVPNCKRTLLTANCKECIIGFQSSKGSSSSYVCWFIWSSTDGHLSTCRISSQLLHPCLVVHQTARPATTTLSNSQPYSNLVIALSLQADLVSETDYQLNSKPSLTLVFLGAKYFFYFRQHTLIAH